MTRPSSRGEWRAFVLTLVLVDAVAVLAAYVLAYVVRYELEWLALQEVAVNRRGYVVVVALALPVWIAILSACDLYRRDTLLGGPQEYARLVTAGTFGFAAVALLSFLSAGAPAVSRGWLVASWPLAIATTGAGRFAMRRLAYTLRRRGFFVSRTVIIGANAQGLAIAQQIDDPRGYGVSVAGFLDDYLPAGAIIGDRWPVLGAPDILATLPADEAIVVQHALTWESLHDLMRALAAGAPGPAVRLAPTFIDLLTAGMSVTHRAHVPVISLDRSRIAGLDRMLKTGFELSVTVLLLFALAPLMAAEALGRSIRRQRMLVRGRYRGLRGSVVTLPCFSPLAPETARLRQLVEKSPALIGVLRGKVALIGPRLVAMDDQSGAGHVVLRSIKPGLTGPASIFGVPLPEETALALELNYIRNYSIWRDIQIVFQRILVLLRPQKAHPPLPAAETEFTAPWPASEAPAPEAYR